jgi:hypothetical protein
VSLITGTAERQAAIEFAKAAALRPQLVGAALREVMERPAVGAALFDVLEAQRIIESGADLVLVPDGNQTLAALLAAR